MAVDLIGNFFKCTKKSQKYNPVQSEHINIKINVNSIVQNSLII